MEHFGHWPHDGMNPNTTWSPGARPVTPGPDLEHLAGALVAADHGELLDPELLLRLRGERQVAGEEVLVGVAQPGPDELHQHLTRLGRIELDLLDAPVGLRLPQDRGLHLHGRRPFPSNRRTRQGQRDYPLFGGHDSRYDLALRPVLCYRPRRDERGLEPQVALPGGTDMRSTPRSVMPSRTRRRVMIGVLTSAALVFAACGGDDDDASSDTGAPSSDAPADTAADAPADTVGRHASRHRGASRHRRAGCHRWRSNG